MGCIGVWSHSTPLYQSHALFTILSNILAVQMVKSLRIHWMSSGLRVLHHRRHNTDSRIDATARRNMGRACSIARQLDVNDDGYRQCHIRGHHRPILASTTYPSRTPTQTSYKEKDGRATRFHDWNFVRTRAQLKELTSWQSTLVRAYALSWVCLIESCCGKAVILHTTS